jgi:hypothetical protein
VSKIVQHALTNVKSVNLMKINALIAAEIIVISNLFRPATVSLATSVVPVRLTVFPAMQAA